MLHNLPNLGQCTVSREPLVGSMTKFKPNMVSTKYDKYKCIKEFIFPSLLYINVSEDLVSLALIRATHIKRDPSK